MYRVIIVDDELMIRNGIAKIIPWQKIGVDKVFTAESGARALQMIAEEPVDLMLTDINMTEMDGLQLIEKARKILPQLRIVVLTGYDSFEYAQQCCKLHVQDFLLKPVDEKELEEILKKQLDILSKSKAQQEQQKRFNRVQGVLEQVRLEQTLRDLLQRQITAEHLGAVLQEYHYPVNQPVQAVVVMPKLKLETGFKEEQELLSLSVKHLCINVIDSHGEGITFEGPGGNIVIVLFCNAEFEEAAVRMDKLRRMIYDEYDLQVKLSLGGAVEGFKELAYSYGEAVSLLHTHEKDSLSDVLQPQKTERRMRLFYEIFEELKKTMVANIAEYDRLDRTFHAFEDCTESYNLSNSMVRRCCFDLASTLYFVHVSEQGETADSKLNALISSLITASKADACRFTGDFLSQMFGDKETDTHEIIEKAKRYIAQHLSDELSVSSIAESLYVTPNYFSRLFKKVCGEGCNEYIVRKRIHMAKSLLETTNQKTGKVALLVGYRDTNYFSLAFKKQTGMSPTEYRENARKDG